MKITALDNVTCEDLGLEHGEDARQTEDLVEEFKSDTSHARPTPANVLRKAWRRGIAFALAGGMDGKRWKVEELVGKAADYGACPGENCMHVPNSEPVCTCGRDADHHCNPHYTGDHSLPCCK